MTRKAQRPNYDAEEFRRRYLLCANGQFFSIRMRRLIGFVGKNGYVFMSAGKARTTVSRFVWFYVTGEWPEIEIDHIDGNPLNNDFSNLRKATRFEQGQNYLIRKTNLGGYTGIHRRGKSWRAAIKAYGKKINLGSWATPEEAHAAYLEGKRKYHTFHPVMNRSGS